MKTPASPRPRPSILDNAPVGARPVKTARHRGMGVRGVGVCGVALPRPYWEYSTAGITTVLVRQPVTRAFRTSRKRSAGGLAG